jgi:hypothetical protein
MSDTVRLSVSAAVAAKRKIVNAICFFMVIFYFCAVKRLVFPSFCLTSAKVYSFSGLFLLNSSAAFSAHSSSIIVLYCLFIAKRKYDIFGLAFFGYNLKLRILRYYTKPLKDKCPRAASAVAAAIYLVYTAQLGYTFGMEPDIVCKKSAFRHGITEDDIYTAFSTAVLDVMLRENL